MQALARTTRVLRAKRAATFSLPGMAVGIPIPAPAQMPGRADPWMRLLRAFSRLKAWRVEALSSQTSIRISSLEQLQGLGGVGTWAGWQVGGQHWRPSVSCAQEPGLRSRSCW